MLIDSYKENWKLMKRFVLRTTGFPFHLLEKMNLTRTYSIMDKWLKINQRREELASEFLQRYYEQLMDWEWKRDKKEQQQYYQIQKAKKYFIQRIPLPTDLVEWWGTREYPTLWTMIALNWNQLFQEEKKLLEDAEIEFKDEFSQKRFLIKEIAEDSQFQEAVFLSSPSAFKAVERHLKAWRNVQDNELELNRDIRKNESLIYSYLQRFCSKNDTTSFFGPINYGEFDPKQANSLQIEHTDRNQLQKRVSSLSQWCIYEMARRISEDEKIKKYIPPKRNPLVTISEGIAIYYFLDKTTKLPSAYVQLLYNIDGKKTPIELSKLMNIRVEKIEQMLGQLKRAGIIRHQIEISATRVPLLEDLLEIVRKLPSSVRERWLSFVEEAIQLRDKFQRADWPERIHYFQEAEDWMGAWYQNEVRRKGGKVYGDRLIFNEDCVGSVRKLKIGGELYSSLYSQGALLLEFLKIPAALRWLDYQDQAQQTFERLKQGRNSIPYTELIQALDNPDIHFKSVRVREFEKRASSLLVSDTKGYILKKEHVKVLNEEYKSIVDQVFRYMPLSLPSPDLMVSASSQTALEKGEFQVVLGEIHDDWSTIYDGVFGYLHPEADLVKKEMEDMICSFPFWKKMSSIVSNRRHKHITPELPGWTIELGSKSIKSLDRVVPIGDVLVTKMNDILTLQYQEQDILLYPGDVGTISHGAFSLPRIIPIELSISNQEKMIPRILLGDMVYQRAKWKIDTKDYQSMEVPNSIKLIMAGRRLKEKYKLPTQFFVKWKSTEKPVFVDLRNYWALDWMFRTMKKVEQFELLEVLPDCQSLWWEGTKGRQTCEIRMGFTYSHLPFLNLIQEKIEGDLFNGLVE